MWNLYCVISYDYPTLGQITNKIMFGATANDMRVDATIIRAECSHYKNSSYQGQKTNNYWSSVRILGDIVVANPMYQCALKEPLILTVTSMEGHQIPHHALWSRQSCQIQAQVSVRSSHKASLHSSLQCSPTFLSSLLSPWAICLLMVSYRSKQSFLNFANVYPGIALRHFAKA